MSTSENAENPGKTQCSIYISLSLGFLHSIPGQCLENAIIQHPPHLLTLLRKGNLVFEHFGETPDLPPPVTRAGLEKYFIGFDVLYKTCF